AANASRAYGSANPVFTVTAAGAENGVTFTLAATTAATVASPAGSYAIVPTALGANLSNYTVVYDNGVLTVGQATLTVTAANAGRAYGCGSEPLELHGELRGWHPDGGPGHADGDGGERWPCVWHGEPGVHGDGH